MHPCTTVARRLHRPRLARPLLALAGFLVLAALPAAPVRAAAAPASAFPLPPELRPAVAFWIDIYSRYTTDQTVIHDDERLDVVYRVLDFSDQARRSPGDRQRARIRARAEERAKDEVREMLERIAERAGRPERLSPEERRIYERFASGGRRATARALLDAAGRVRAQVGQRDRFIEAIQVSGRYLPEMERIFELAGLPVELTRLVFVESMFDLEARSSAGASGVWQFIRSTGRRYLRIGSLVDERNDPFLSTRAAAQHLAENYAELGSWPLAITAYNHGKYGMLKAVEQLGTRDIGRIVTEYRGRAFGFASRNFYAEFLAALHVEQNARRYFGPIERETPVPYVLVEMTGDMTVRELARTARLDVGVIHALNPALTRRALTSRHHLPRGYALRVPADRRDRLVAAKLDVRPGWRPAVAVASNRTSDRSDDAAAGSGRPGEQGPSAATAAAPLAVPRIAARAEPSAPQAADGAPTAGGAPTPALDPDAYLDRMMAAEEEALDRLLAAAEPAGSRPMARPLEATGDRLVDAAVEALDLDAAPERAEDPASAPRAAGRPDEPSQDRPASPARTVRPGARVVAAVAPSGGPTFLATVRGGETVWRFVEWSEEPIEAFLSRNRLDRGQRLAVGQVVSVSAARVDRETFEARRAAFHESLRERAAHEYSIVGTRTHVVAPGETPWSLAAEIYKIPFWLLEQMNPKLDLSAVKAGDTIRIPIIDAPVE